MNKNRSSGVSWVKPAEPSFLTKFKSDVGFKEGPNVDTKRQVMPDLDDDSGSDREDELPQVVVLKSGDLTAEEVKNIKDEMDDRVDAEEGSEASGGKILFKKPAKRSSSDKFHGITATSSKKKKSNEGGEKEGKSGNKVKNNSLLSFGGDEDDEDD
uniref:KIAA1143 n=1 Tax=Iconisemion striatum TaxID=60296 RepID=A0A1A7YC81_9TELE